MCRSSFHPSFCRRRNNGFTLVEVLVATSVLALMLVLMLKVVNLSTSTITQASLKIDAFGTGRSAFDIVTQRLSQATLNTYWDYYDASGKSMAAVVNGSNLNSTTFRAVSYGRASDLQFVVRQNSSGSYGQEVYFQTPEGFASDPNYQSTQGLLNACGYFVRYGSNQNFRPDAVSGSVGRWRYRLMQALQTTEDLKVFQQAKNDDLTWADAINNDGNPVVRPLADNVIAMIVWPRQAPEQDPDGTSLTSDYSYDSQKSPAPTGATHAQPVQAHQLPPTVQVTLILIDEASASRMDTHTAAPPADIENALRGKFIQSTADAYRNDVYGDGTPTNPGLIKTLAASRYRINCQIFNTSVVLRESKWSK